jgi:ABC-2 type transport system permease protein
VKLQRVIALTKKEIKKTIREPAVLFMIFLFPMVFVFVFGTSFGGGTNQNVTYNIGVVNLDNQSIGQLWSQTLINDLSNTKIISLKMYPSNMTAQSDLSQGKIQSIVTIPKDFSVSVNSYMDSPNDPSRWVNSTISLYLDKGSLIATQAVPSIIQMVLSTTLGQAQVAPKNPLHLEVASLVEVKQSSPLDFFAPGMFTFASVFLIMMVGQSFAQDRENGMMKRIRITPTSATEFMTSQVVSYMIIALIQATLVFTLTYAMGFKPNVGIAVYATAFTLVSLFSLSCVGFGLITATIAKSPGAATGISFLFVLPQLFLGTFFGASLNSAAQVADRFVPSYYVTDAITSLLLRGAAISSPTIIFDLVIVIASCVAILAIGIILYAKYYKI